MKYAVLVYQAGIANVFQVNEPRSKPFRRRILQHAFEPCEWFVRGLAEAGWHVTSMQANVAGDVSLSQWSADLDAAPFRESMNPCFSGGKR